jgi:preprotein translocase subunit YajC
MYALTLLAGDDNANAGGSGIFTLAIFLLIPLAMYFLMIRPQRRRMREQQAMQTSLEVGDEVITTAGVYGFITGIDDDGIIWVEIDKDVQIRVNRNFIQGKVDTSGAAEAAPTKADDKGDASSAEGAATDPATHEE